MFKHLKKQRTEDITTLVKPKEIMFCGRSNIGKSSLIQALFEDGPKTRVSKHAVSVFDDTVGNNEDTELLQSEERRCESFYC